MQEAECNLPDCFLCMNCTPRLKEAIAIKKKSILFKKEKQLFTESNPVKFIFFVYSRLAKVHKRWSNMQQNIYSYARTTYETIFRFYNELQHKKIIFPSGKNIRSISYTH
jgi:hypothetical protein